MIWWFLRALKIPDWKEYNYGGFITLTEEDKVLVFLWDVA